MKLTKYTHACVRLEKDNRVLVLDPGTFSETAEALSGADAVLVTHEHGDHIDVPAVVNALKERPEPGGLRPVRRRGQPAQGSP
jgi:L-ascorbate metabolism protein UlaG (beta-lactamase superfamily)